VTVVVGANLLIFGGLRICMVDFGWRASFGESTEEVGRDSTVRLGASSSTLENPGG
jgi:hypothetical protein